MPSKKAFGGAIRKAAGQMVGRAAPPRMIEASSAPAGKGPKGALSRVVSRVAPQSQKNPQPVKRQPVGNAGPVKSFGNSGLIANTDQTTAETGEGLRKLVGRIASGRGRFKKGGKVQKYKEGGKVGTAMSALQQLAKKYRQALDLDDTESATRISRQMERLEPGSSKKVSDSGEEARKDKLATFAKGGKVKGVDRVASRLLATLKRLELDPHEFDLFDKKGNLRVEEAKEVIEDAIEGEREVDDLKDSLGTDDPEEITKKIQSKVRRGK